MNTPINLQLITASVINMWTSWTSTEADYKEYFPVFEAPGFVSRFINLPAKYHIAILIMVVMLVTLMIKLYLWVRSAKIPLLEKRFRGKMPDAPRPSDARPGRFILYWASRLRMAMNYPRKYSESNRMVACNRLEALWREEVPDLRYADKAHYMPQVVALAFVASDNELFAEDMVRHPEAKRRRAALALPDF